MSSPPPPPPFAFNSLVQPSSSVGQTVPTGFDAPMAYLLASCVEAAVEAYAQGSPTIPQATLDALPLAGNAASYQQLGTLYAPEAFGVAASTSTPGAYINVLIGVAIQALDSNNNVLYSVIALRGTQTYQEWINDVTALPQSYALVEGAGYVHSGFYTTYTNGTDGTSSTTTARVAGSLAFQIEALLSNTTVSPTWPTDVPLYVTGHSLGAALAELCAFDIISNLAGYVSGITMYVFAPPKVSAGLVIDGLTLYDVTTFPQSFQATALTAFAVVNAADLVPIMPPTLSTSVVTVGFAPVVPAGNTVTYCAQLGGIGDNHELAVNYLPYAQALVGIVG